MARGVWDECREGIIASPDLTNTLQCYINAAGEIESLGVPYLKTHRRIRRSTGGRWTMRLRLLFGNTNLSLVSAQWRTISNIGIIGRAPKCVDNHPCWNPSVFATFINASHLLGDTISDPLKHLFKHKWGKSMGLIHSSSIEFYAPTLNPFFSNYFLPINEV